MARIFPAFFLLTTASLLAQARAAGVDLGEHQHGSMQEVPDRAVRTLDDWIDRFRLSGFVAARYFDTAAGGSRPDGALVVQAATLFVDADVRDVGSVFVELRLDYFHEAGQNNVGVGEAHLVLRDVVPLDDATGLGVKVGRFDLPFGEYYLTEDPDQNRLIGLPAAIPYRWDEGVLGFADFGGFGFAAAFTDGTASRDSSSGIAPAATVRLHARPWAGVYASASGMYIHAAAASALCLGGSVIRPVTGSATGTSPNTGVRSSLGSIDVLWQVTERLHLQASGGGGRIDDQADEFDRTIFWWMLEPSFAVASGLDATLRYSGAGTFDDRDGYRFEGRPYANGSASYGFDLASLQRVALGVRRTFAPGLVGKVEVGFDHLIATDVSGLSNDTRVFTAAELVLSF